MLKGFKDFIMRGNVVDLAVGVVIGAAFTGVVTQLTKSFLNHWSGSSRWDHRQQERPRRHAPTFRGIDVRLGGLRQRADHLPLTAAALYFLVVYPMNRLAERRKRGEEPPPAAPERGGQAAHRDPGRAGRRRPRHARPAARRAGRRAGPPARSRPAPR